MTKIDAALDRYEAAAKSAGYKLCPEISTSFDEKMARSIFSRYRVKENADYFALLKRWNGMYLEKELPDGIIIERPAGLDYDLASFEGSLEQFELFNDEEGEVPETGPGGYFFVFFDDGGNPIGFPCASGGPELYVLPLQGTYGITLKFISISAAIETFASAIEAGLTLSDSADLDERAWTQEQLAFARIAKSFNPGVILWDQNIAGWEADLAALAGDATA